jgi:hypothetical protein
MDSKLHHRKGRDGLNSLDALSLHVTSPKYLLPPSAIMRLQCTCLTLSLPGTQTVTHRQHHASIIIKAGAVDALSLVILQQATQHTLDRTTPSANIEGLHGELRVDPKKSKHQSNISRELRVSLEESRRCPSLLWSRGVAVEVLTTIAVLSSTVSEALLPWST